MTGESRALKSYKTGLMAETAAAFLLCLKGYRILARRYKTPVGEIGMVACRGKTLVFIEVKARRDAANALQSVTAHMQMRFDLMAVSPPFFCRHLDNAWRPPS